MTNPNVAHEVGYALGLGKEVIPLCRENQIDNVAANLNTHNLFFFPDCCELGSDQYVRLKNEMEMILRRRILPSPIHFTVERNEVMEIEEKISSLRGDVL